MSVIERVRRRSAAALGLILGAGPALLENLLPQFAGFDQLGVVALGAILGMRAGMRSRRARGRLPISPR